MKMCVTATEKPKSQNSKFFSGGFPPGPLFTNTLYSSSTSSIDILKIYEFISVSVLSILELYANCFNTSMGALGIVLHTVTYSGCIPLVYIEYFTITFTFLSHIYFHSFTSVNRIPSCVLITLFFMSYHTSSCASVHAMPHSGHLRLTQ